MSAIHPPSPFGTNKTPIKGAPSTMGNDVPLNTTTLIRHAARSQPTREVVYRAGDEWKRTDFAGIYRNVSRQADAMANKLGVKPGDTVGVLDWNTRNHFELYWSIPALAAVMLQMNIRLSPEDLSYVVKDSNASVIFVDETLLPVAHSIEELVPGVKTWVVMTAEDRPVDAEIVKLKNWISMDELVEGANEDYDFPIIDETSAYSACYTTGTTGRPKGVFYSHRSIVLHAYATAKDIGVRSDDTVMLITPMFHASGWGLAQVAVLSTTKVVLPGRYSADTMQMLSEALVNEEVTVVNGAPAIFSPMLTYIESLDEAPDLSRLRMMSGSSEPPLKLMRGFYEACGAEIVHAYGATETSPLVTVNRFTPDVLKKYSDDELWELKRKQGYPVTNVDVRLLDGIGNEVPWDGESAGELCVRGPWITRTYHGMSDEDLEGRFVDGYWRSGDIGTIDEDGYLKLTDRLKDVIKSGGEWISSIDMENLLMSHPGLSDAVVVGIAHPKWMERPFVLAVAKDPANPPTLESIHEHLSKAFAKWQLPDAVEYTDELPRTSVGKLNKKLIREQFADYYTN